MEDEEDEIFTCLIDGKKYKHNEIIEHIMRRHGYIYEAVCPICVVRGGNPNYVSRDLIGHLKLRHYNDPYYCPSDKYYEQLMIKLIKKGVFGF